MKYLYLIIVLMLVGCNNNTSVKSNLVDKQTESIYSLDKYWYQGKAEITTYSLDQNRYQGIHQGEVVMIFVTEDFLTDIQVKNDRYKNSNSTSILKNNKIARFTTGIYDYSMMTSVFTPVDRKIFSHTLKVTMSSQDWCGQSYHQLNFRNGRYDSKLHSYFEKEADRQRELNGVILEDEIVNLIRFNPNLLPQGEISIIPALSFLRLRHVEEESFQANASLWSYAGAEWSEKSLLQYSIEYPDLQRTITYFIQKEAPYNIIGWDDAYPSAFDGEIRITKARKVKAEMVDYWNKNKVEDGSMRKNLGLSNF